jgi:hypothetical protein
MATETQAVPIDRAEASEIEATIGGIKRMLKIGAVFAVVGYLLIIGALVLEFTSFHPLIEDFFTTYTDTSLAGGGAERTAAGINEQLTSIHQFPSMLLWLKLGGIGHILVGIFVALAAIIRALSVMPHRLSYEMERTQG